jgi:hypothetical protein
VIEHHEQHSNCSEALDVCPEPVRTNLWFRGKQASFRS